MIPDLTDEGLLPPGIHIANINEIVERFSRGSLNRATIAHNLSIYYQRIRKYAVGIYVDGSFVTGKFSPNDVDLLVIYPSDFDFDANTDLQELLFKYRNGEKIGHKIHNISAREKSDKAKDGIRFFSETRDGKGKGILYLECAE